MTCECRLCTDPRFRRNLVWDTGEALMWGSEFTWREKLPWRIQRLARRVRYGLPRFLKMR